MDTKAEAGRRIKAARLALGLRLEDVCSRIPELTVSRLSNWEQGRNLIGVEEAKKLAPVLGVSAGYILTLEDAPADKRESALLQLFRESDERGRTSIFRVAESQSAYAAGAGGERKGGSGAG